jgi:hypothetical protein
MSGSQRPDAKAPKAPARPAPEILADIKAERAALSSSFEALRRDLDEALVAGRGRAGAAGKKAAVIAPVVAGLAVSVTAAALLLRRRRSAR